MSEGTSKSLGLRHVHEGGEEDVLHWTIKEQEGRDGLMENSGDDDGNSW